MKWQIISVGKPAFAWARAAAEQYLGRLQKGSAVEWTVLRAVPPAKITGQMLELSQGTMRIVLDERGRQMTSVEFSKWIARQELSGKKAVSILIGAADGHQPELRASADELWSLSTMTLQHEMALVLFLEQLYRAYSILRGDPYHRE